MPAPHHSVFRLDALPAAQPTASKHWRPTFMTYTVLNGETTSIMWPTLGSRTAKEQNRTELCLLHDIIWRSFNYSERSQSHGAVNNSVSIYSQSSCKSIHKFSVTVARKCHYYGEYRQILITVATTAEYGFQSHNQHDILIHFVTVLQSINTVWKFKTVPRQVASQSSWIFIHTFCTITLMNTGSDRCLYLSPCTCTAWSKNAHLALLCRWNAST